ncbi:hypothetical protein CRG98_003272 [Punica granatum]|uniref:Uncharacterized protein n=1 Tax=Punica granatum TaxID=22663 RepID=A0A2I0L6U1_PUNGR|nr:hypothetical protein CRG98_003272 [Punica granatum]
MNAFEFCFVGHFYWTDILFPIFAKVRAGTFSLLVLGFPRLPRDTEGDAVVSLSDGEGSNSDSDQGLPSPERNMNSSTLPESEDESE